MTRHVRVEQAQHPIRVCGPAQQGDFVLVTAELYERFKSLFDDDPVTPEERQFHLQQFGRRAGWDDPAMDVYDELDPRRSS